MNQVAQDSPLSQLRDIHTPDAISAWPPAIGWWLLAIIGLIVLWLLVVKVRYYLHKRRHDYRRLALQQCTALETQLAQTTTDIEAQKAVLSQANALLKQTAMAAYSREAVAKRSGADWLLFLQAQLPTALQAERAKPMANLQQAVYQGAALSKQDAAAALSAVRVWIKSHQLPQLPQLPVKTVSPTEAPPRAIDTQKERA